MSEKKPPKWAGDGVAVWLNQKQDGEYYVTVQILGSITRNCWLVKEKPKQKPVEEWAV